MGRPRNQDNWADRYQSSDHHTDRLIRIKVNYEDVTGTNYPEPIPNHKMAWGKGGTSNVVRVTTNSTGRRAYSVPDDHISFDPIGSRTAFTVSHAKEDTDTMSSASRRQDQRLLKDISNRLATANFSQPSGKHQPRSRSRRSVAACGSGYTTPIRRSSVPSPGRPLLSKPRMRASASMADEDFEIVFPSNMSTRDLPPCARRALNRAHYGSRSASVPPPSQEPSKPRGYELIDHGSPLMRVVDGPVTKPIYQSTYARTRVAGEVDTPRLKVIPIPLARRRHSIAVVDDLLPRMYNMYLPRYRPATTHTITTPRPYVRRYSPLPYARQCPYYWIEPEYEPLKFSYAYRPVSSELRSTVAPKSTSLAVRQARDSLGRIERELGMGRHSVPDYDDVVIPRFEEPVVTNTTVVPMYSSRPVYYNQRRSVAGAATTPPPIRRSSYSYGSLARAPASTYRPSTRQQEIEARLDMMTPQEPAVSSATYSNLRSRTSAARNKLDQHRTMMDRYLPVPTTMTEVPADIDFMFGELAERMPQLLPRHRRTEETSRSTSAPPYRPLSSSARGVGGDGGVGRFNDPLRAQYKPVVSETRRRARAILCKTKRDPHYFDD